MNDTPMMLSIILSTLLTTPVFAIHQVELHPVYNKANHHTGYAAKVMIGNPEKQFVVLLDTVTKFLWVVGDSRLHGFCSNKEVYSQLNSSTCTTIIPKSLVQVYGLRLATICVWNDDISINSLYGERVNFKNSQIGTICLLQWNEWEDYQQIDGVFGLSALHVDDFDFANPLKKAIRDGQLNTSITIALPPLDSDQTAVLTLGEPDRRLCNVNSETNEPLFFSQNRYDFQYRSIRMGNISYKSEFRQGIAYPHTIKSYIGVPDEFLQQIVRDFNATMNQTSKKYMVDCQRSFEPFEMFTDENIYVVAPEHFIIRHDQNDEQCELAFRSRKNKFNDAITLGIPFFHQFCVTLEPLIKRISFSPII